MSNPTPPITDGLVLAIIPAARSLLDFSGAGRDPTIAGTGLNWIRQNGVYGLRAQDTGQLVVANDATLEAMTDFSLFFGGASGGVAATRRLFNKRDAGGTHLDVYLTPTTGVTLYDGVGSPSADIGSWAGVRNFAVVLESGAIGNLYANGAWRSVFSGASTITGHTADITLLNYYTGANPSIDPYRAILLYNRVLTADENSILGQWSDSLSSPTISPNRRYFDRGSWVANGPQPSYGDTGPDLVTDGDMEAVGTASWVAQANAVPSKEAGSPSGVGSQVLRATGDGITGFWGILQNCHMVVGKRYRARGWARSDGTVTPRLVSGAGVIFWTGVPSVTWQYFDVSAVTDHDAFIMRDNAASNGWFEFDDLTVEQTNNLLSDGMMEDSGVGAWTAGSSAKLTKETDNPHGGLRVLRVMHDGAADPYARQTILEIGKTYIVAGWARGDDFSDYSYPVVRHDGVNLWAGTRSLIWQGYNVEFVATTTTIDFVCDSSSLNLYADFDDITVHEVFKTVGAWDLGVITNNEVADKSGAGNHLTVTGNVCPVPTEVGRAAHFDGVASSVSLTGITGAVGDYSFEFLVRYTATGTFQYLADVQTGRIIIGGLSDVANNIGVYDGAWRNFGAAPNDGLWHHLVFNLDAGNTLCQYFVDGTQQGGDLAYTPRAIGGNVALCSEHGGTTENLACDLAFAKVRNRLMTEAEILAAADKLARTCLYYQDMSGALPTVTPIVAGQQIPGTEYHIASGTWRVDEDAATGERYIECIVAGIIYRENKFAYGTWDIGLYKGSGATFPIISIIANQAAAFNAAGSDGYLVTFNTGEQYESGRFTNGAYVSQFTTPAAYVVPGINYNIRTTRSAIGVFSLYIKGGAFENWELSPGANPYTDNNHTASQYCVFDLDALDRIYHDRTYAGVVPPV